MATEIASAYVSLVPSARGISRGITQELSGLSGVATTVGDDVSKNLHSRITSGFSRTVSELGRIAKTGGVLIGAGLVGAGFWGVKQAADFQQTTVAFEGILGSGEKAKSFLSDLRKFAAKTPFELPGLADAAKNLLAVGFGAEDVLPIMTDLGDVAATLGVGEAEISGVVRALGQMKGKGKASAEELQQISEQIPGFSAIAAIADGMGVSVSDAFALVSKGAVPADDAIGFILEGMRKFPGASGAMERQSKTLNGVMSTFKDTLSTTAIDFITPYLPTLSQGVQKLSDWITVTLIPNMHSFVDYVSDELAPKVTDAFDAVSGWWDEHGQKLSDNFTGILDVAGKVFGGIAAFVLFSMIPALAVFAGWVADHQPALVVAILGLGTAFAFLAVNAIAAAIAEGAILLPLFLAAAAMAVLAGIVYYAYQHSQLFHDQVWRVIYALMVVGGWLKAVGGFFSDLAGFISDAIGKLDEFVGKLGPLKGLLSGPLGIVLSPLGFLKGHLAAGGPIGPGSWLVGENGPEILTMGQGQRGYVTANADIGSAASGALIGSLTVVERPGENQVETAFREARRASLMAGT